MQKQMEKQEERHRQQMKVLLNRLETGGPALVAPAASVPSFTAFDSTSELWRDYLARFHTFVEANSIPAEKIAQVFLTNQTNATYNTLAGQQSPP